MTPEPPSPFATIREVHAVEATLLKEMRAMEDRLAAKIEHANEVHDSTHDHMRRRADERHARIDEYIETQLLAAATEQGAARGRSGAFGQAYAVLRLINEFRVLIGIGIATALLLLNDIHVTLT